MTLTELLIAGIKRENHYDIDWIRSLFCVTEPKYTTPYPYHVVQRIDGIYYAEPDNPEQYTKVESNKGELLLAKTPITLQAGDLPNVTKPIKTVVGNVLVNAILVCYPFGNKLPFLEGVLNNTSRLENLILSKLEDNPKDPSLRKPDEIYVDEFVKLSEAINYLTELADVFVAAASPKQLVPPPGIIEYRNKLLKENKDRLDDPAVLAEIDKKLVEYDTKFLADDEIAEAFLTKRARSEGRRKMFLMVGSQTGFKDGVKVENVPFSLNERPTVDSLAAVRSAARVGSFSRGYETMKGGAKFKELLRAATNAKVEDTDCGTKLGVTTILTEDNYKSYLDFYFQTPKGPVQLTEQNYKEFLNKPTIRRSTQFCQTEATDYCKYCVGARLSLHPNAIPVAVSDIGSVFLTLSLKKMHVSGRTNVSLDLDEAIS